MNCTTVYKRTAAKVQITTVYTVGLDITYILKQRRTLP